MQQKSSNQQYEKLLKEWWTWLPIPIKNRIEADGFTFHNLKHHSCITMTNNRGRLYITVEFATLIGELKSYKYDIG